MMLRWTLIVAALLGVAALLSWRWLGWQAIKAETRHQFPTVPRIQTNELAAWLADPHQRPPVLLDVREAAEFNVSHLPQARRVEPGSDLAALHLPKDEPIVTYCSVGYRSAALANRLQQAGYDQVRNLEGSIFQWANEGRPLVVNDGQPATQVHPFNPWWGLLLQPGRSANVPASAGSNKR